MRSIFLFLVWSFTAAQAFSQAHDPAKVARLHEHIKAEHPAIRSFLVKRAGEPLFEYYRDGLNADTLHHVASVTKSVVSLLAGIAIDQGLIGSAQEKFPALFPHNIPLAADPRLKEMNLAHLLTLSSGFSYRHLAVDTDYSDFQMRFYASGLLDYAVSRTINHQPGQHFYYSNLDAHLVSIAIAQRAQVDIAAFAQEHLFKPLQIQNASWLKTSQGQVNGASELRLTTRDMAKLGQLVLQKGRWGTRQIVSQAYVLQATARQLSTGQLLRGGPDTLGYGFLWWIASTPKDKLTAVYAAGYGGQFIYVVPALDAVIVATTDAESRAVAAKTASVIRDFALPILH